MLCKKQTEGGSGDHEASVEEDVQTTFLIETLLRTQDRDSWWKKVSVDP